VSAKSCLIKDL
jgi:chromosome segregation ATPase